MKNYAYNARDNQGKVVKGTMLAENEIELANRLRKLNYFLIRADITDLSSVPQSKIGRLSKKEVLNFTIHMATLLDAGVPLVSALKGIVEESEKKEVRAVVEDIRRRVEAGSSLKEALSVHLLSFSKLYVSIVGAGESTGELIPCLNNLSSLIEWQMELSSKIKEASIYPVILILAMLGVVTLLVVRIIPMFEPMFAELDVELPLITQIVLGFSHSVRSFGLLVLVLIIALVIAYKVARRDIKARIRFDKMKLKIPLVGNLINKIVVSRFCHTFSLAMKSGVNILGALDLSREVIGNAYLERSVADASRAINVGEKIATALGNTGAFPVLVIRMVSIGEQSGALTETLEKVTQFYDKEVPATIRKMFAIAEPLMIVVMGVVVGGIAASLFLPLFKLVSSIGG